MDQAHYEKRSSTAKGLLLGVCFVGEDPKEREHLRQTLSEAALKLSPTKLWHSGRSQDDDNEVVDKQRLTRCG